MKISCTSAEVMIIEFTKDELSGCHLTYEILREYSAKSKAAICRIIEETQKISGKSIKVSPETRVDILPDGEGGCIIVLNSRQETGSFTSTAVYESDTMDAILDFASLAGMEEGVKSSLFEKDGTYRLLMDGEKKIQNFCSEFLYRCEDTDRTLTETEIYYNCLIPANALKVLGGFASEE